MVREKVLSLPILSVMDVISNVFDLNQAIYSLLNYCFTYSYFIILTFFGLFRVVESVWNKSRAEYRTQHPRHGFAAQQRGCNFFIYSDGIIRIMIANHNLFLFSLWKAQAIMTASAPHKVLHVNEAWTSCSEHSQVSHSDWSDRLLLLLKFPYLN